ncbi:MAG TPA: CvpA family protein [Lacipirellulaceae bacterium]|nr:CvpA family protein [Lacipirellulaceae bacterium]
MAYLCVLIYVVAFAGIAMTVNEGLWNNMLSLMAVLVCGPLAIAAGYPLGLFLQEKIDKPVEQTWYFIFAGVWLSFFLSIMILRLLLDRTASRTRMKFAPPLELAGGPLVGIGVAVVFASFFTYTLYTIPLNAGEYWNLSEATSWQRSTFETGSGPFNAVLKAMAGADVASYHLP